MSNPQPLVVPYNDEKYPFAGLANWSCAYPFKVDGKEYPSVDHFIYSRLTLHEYDAQLLSIRGNDPSLRFHYNSISNEIYYRLFRTILSKGVQAQYNDRSSENLRSVIQRHPSHYYYYITNDDLMWGINDQGYGFNLVGQSYARIIDPRHSYYYNAHDPAIIHQIYIASVLCQHHLQQGHDIMYLIGKSVGEMTQSLEKTYPGFIASLPLTSKEVFDRYQQDNFFEFIQYEIDYPWNLAGFLRQAYSDKLNFYLRRRFNRTMVLAYFRHVLSQKFGGVIDLGRLEEYAQHQLLKLSEDAYQTLVNRLYALYNDPDTTNKTHAFLTPEIRKQLYDTEMQFLGNEEIVTASMYIPFLYQIKPNATTYIYDENHGFTEELEPFTKLLSPFQYNPLTMATTQFDDLASYAFTTLLQEWTKMPMEHAFKNFRTCVDMEDYQESLANSIRAFKRLLIQQGMTIKFRSSAFARYELYNTQSYGYDIHILDPDSTFELQMNKELMALRTKLDKDPMYALTYSISSRHIPQLQDRIRFRIQDFVHTFEAYRRFLGKDKLDAKDYETLERLLYRDPSTTSSSSVSSPVPLHFQHYFEKVCDGTTIQKLWKFFGSYNDVLESYLTVKPADRPCTPPRVEIQGGSSSVSDKTPIITTIPAIVAYFVQHFYREGEEMAFYLFVLSILIGKHIHSFTPSFAYYSMELERELRTYLSLDEYETTFVVNLMGVIGRLQREMPSIRIRYFGYLTSTNLMTPKETDEIGESFTRRLRALGFPVIETEKEMRKRSKALEKKRKADGRKSKKEIMQEILRPTSMEAQQQQQQEEEDVDVEELYEEFGIDDDEVDTEMEEEPAFEQTMMNEF